MIVSGQENQQKEEKTETSSALIVSWKSMETRRAELEEITNKKIPENTKDIAIARSYGDMRENHEFKAAKEMQTVLLRRQAELEQMLSTAQGTDFKNANTSEVSVGTHVRLRDTRTQEILEYTILGAWDSNPEEGIISYLTSLAKVLLNRKVGEEIELTLDDGGVRQVKLESIEPYNP
jgi:transcription elongation GreA/GreB family factor